MAGGPLEGIRVIDLTSVVVGPLATQVLADHGADVIKIESPSGDIGRHLAGRGRSPGMSAKFMHLNRNKRSMVLDLRQASAREALNVLLKDADVLLWNVRPASMQRLGLDYASVRAINPRLIYCGMFGFGQGGRYRDRPAYDSIIQGISGVAALHERASGTPRYVPYVMADRTVGLIAVQLILMALLRRVRSGEGESIEIPMFENMVTQVMTEHMYQASFDPPIGGYGDPRVLDPENRPLATRDGFLCLSANTDAQAHALFEAIGQPELATDPRFATVAARFQHVQAYFAIRAQGLAQKTTAEWIEIFDRLDVPAAPYHRLETLRDDPHLRDVGLFQTVDHPTEGGFVNIGLANRMSGGARSDFRGAPRLGQHTREVLREAGFDEPSIEAMLVAGAAVSDD
jgi:crotonobetainyl-CoA:carnitine CoA-transferase CaiB-like acyl-CoA transferase